MWQNLPHGMAIVDMDYEGGLEGFKAFLCKSCYNFLRPLHSLSRQHASGIPRSDDADRPSRPTDHAGIIAAGRSITANQRMHAYVYSIFDGECRNQDPGFHNIFYQSLRPLPIIFRIIPGVRHYKTSAMSRSSHL